MSIQKQKRPKSDIMLEPGAWAVIQTAVTQTITVITKDNDSLTSEINGGSIFSPTCEQRIYRGSIVQVFQVKEFAGNRYYGFRDIHGQEFSHYIPKKNLIHLRDYLAGNIMMLAAVILLSMEADGFLWLPQYAWLAVFLCLAFTLTLYEPLLFLKELLQLAYKRIKQRRDRNGTTLF